MESPLPSLETVWSCGSGDPVFFPLSQNARLCGWAGGAVASSAPAVIPKCTVVASKRRPDKRATKKKCVTLVAQLNRAAGEAGSCMIYEVVVSIYMMWYCLF
jgi:hypothetical protein